MTERGTSSLDRTAEGSLSSAEDDGLSRLMRFHGRIREALYGLAALAEKKTITPTDQATARALLTFFTGPLVWHDIDEESSLIPRLREKVKAEELEEILDEVSAAHVAMEHTIEELLPVLDRVAHAPPGAAPKGVRALATKLDSILLPHLALEEQHLVPFARFVLDDDQLAEISDEIAVREEARQHRIAVHPRYRVPSLPAHAKAYKRREFTTESVPPGFLQNHSLRAHVWGMLTVLEGELTFFDDEEEQEVLLDRGRRYVIAPRARHHLALHADARFEIVFFRA